MEEQKTLVIPAYDAMVFPILCVLILLVVNRAGAISRNEAYAAGVLLVLLYLPFTRHSLFVTEQGLGLRQSIWPRCSRFVWAELAGLTYRRHRSGERATLTLLLHNGRRRRISLNLGGAESAERFQSFLAQARLRLGADAVVEQPPFWRRLFR